MSSMPRVILLISSSAGYERGLLRGIARYAQDRGPWIFFLVGDEPDASILTSESSAVRYVKVKRSDSRRRCSVFELKSLGVTGFIGRIHEPRIAEAVLASGLPAIALDLTEEQLSDKRVLRRVSEIRPDSHEAGCMAAEHLLDRGFHHFAFCGYPKEYWSRLRMEGFCERIQKAGLSCTIYQPRRRESREPWRQEQKAVMAWLHALPKPVGIMACNDVRGRQLIDACAVGGIHVPDQVAVVGVDEDRLLSEFSNPPLSSVALNAEQGGYQAAQLLDRMMAGRVKQRRLLLVDALWVVARASTDAIAVEDPAVSAAMRYIHDNARRPIGVLDVVKHSATSRRALEIRFQRSLGRSIREEIQCVRMVWIKQLLAETNLPLPKIAECTGFSSASYLSKVFRRATGNTLAAYRRDHRTP